MPSSADGFSFDPSPRVETEAEEVEVGQFFPEETPEFPITRTEGGKKSVARRDSVARIKDELREVEDAILKKSSTTIDAALDWATVAGMKGPPREWVEQYGPVEAQKRFVVAQSALCKRSEAPVGLDIAQRTMLGIVRARATERDVDRPLNVQLIQISTNEVPQFPVVVETDGEEG